MGEPLLAGAVGVGRPDTEITQLGVEPRESDPAVSRRARAAAEHDRPAQGARPGPGHVPGTRQRRGPGPVKPGGLRWPGDADAGAAAVPASTRQAATQLGTPSAATSRRPVSATMARDRRFMFSSFVCVPNPRRDVKTVRGPALAGGSGPPRVAGFRNAHQLVIWCG